MIPGCEFPIAAVMLAGRRKATYDVLPVPAFNCTTFGFGHSGFVVDTVSAGERNSGHTVRVEQSEVYGSLFHP